MYSDKDKKAKYESPEAEVIAFADNDVIIASPNTDTILPKTSTPPQQQQFY